MKSFVINDLSIKGFKKYKDPIKYSFSKKNKIIGDNAQGKSSITEAIAWCITGSTIFGKDKNNKELRNNQCKNMEVSMNVTIYNEETSTNIFLLRAYGGKEAGLYINDEKQKNSTAFLDILGIDKETFLSIINPFYFPILQNTDAKSILERNLKKISNEEVYEKISEYESDILKKQNFTNYNLFMEEKKQNIKELEEDLIYIQGYLDNIKLIEVPEDKYSREQIENISKQISELDIAIKKEYVKQPQLPYSLENENERKKILLDKIQYLKNLQCNDLNDLSNLKNSLEQAKIEYKNVPFQLPQLKDVSYLKQRIQNLRNQYSKLLADIKNIPVNNIECPNCHTQFKVNDPARNLLLEQLNNLKIEGKNLAANIKNIEQENKQILDNYNLQIANYRNKKQQLIQQLEQQLNQENQNNNNILADFQRKTSIQIKALETEITCINIEEKERENNNKRNKFNEMQKQKINEMEYKINELLKQNQEIIQYNTNRNNILLQNENINKEIEKTKLKLEEDKKNINQFNLEINCAKTFAKTKIDLQSSQIKEYLNKVDISFEKLIKSTGELKESFSILYDGKDFKILSTSEKIKAGLEISNMLSTLKNISLPIIIDNAESITSYNINNCSQILEMIVKKDQQITIHKED